MEHLSPLDASFLDIEDRDPYASLAIASVAVIDGPAPSQGEFIDAIRGRLPLVPRYRQKVRRVPFDIGRPVWVDDPNVDLDYHLRRTALAAPGDDAALCRLVARVMSQRLDRERPLWETWVIEGLPEGRWAVLSKVHHCMVDGVSGNELYRLMFDPTPEPGGPVADTWTPQPAPDAATLVADALSELTASSVDQSRILLDSLRSPAMLVQRVSETFQGLATIVGSLMPVTGSSLIGPIGSSRRYALVRTPLADLKDVARALGVTFNDVVLATLAGAFRTVMIARGEDPGAETVRTLVPVNVRTAQEEGVLDNRVSMLLPFLPVDRADPGERVAVVHERIETLRRSHEIEAIATMTAMAGYEPFPPVSLAIRTALRLPQRVLSTVITNVPGPPRPLYVLGRRIREILPYVPIAKQMRVGISVFTYDGQAVLGITSDFEHFDRPEQLADAVRDELATLIRTVRGPRIARKRSPVAPVRRRRPTKTASKATASKATASKATASASKPAKPAATRR